MACIKGKSFCEYCGLEFEWIRHDSQKPARFCKRECTNKDIGIRGNKNRIFWLSATENEKKERMKSFFFNKVIQKEGCWGWIGGLDKNGYPYIYGGKGPYKAHRLSYEIHKGLIPEKMRVCHKCDNPTCTNPEHLFLGTSKENTQDSISKGRFIKGEKVHCSKLKEDEVKEIKKMLDLGVTCAYLSRKYKVHYMTIKCIEKNKTWKYIN
jgi:hypothetical protein